MNPKRQLERFDEEVTNKQAELDSWLEKLAEAELRYGTLRAELSLFEAKYRYTIGPYLTELDELHARIANAIACLRPNSQKDQEKAKQAQERAKQTAEEAAGGTPPEGEYEAQEFRPLKP